MQIPAPHFLTHIVKHFLIVENDCVAHTRLRMFSDGNTGMVFNLGDPLLLLSQDESIREILPAVFVYGQLGHFQNIQTTGKVNILIVVFQPFGISSFLHCAASELKNRIITLDPFFGNSISLLSDQLLSQTRILDRIQLIEQFLMREPANGDTGKNTLVCQAIYLIKQHHGNFPMNTLIATLNVSERKLQRTFEEHVGVSPKHFSNISRVQYFLKLLRKNPGESKTRLTYEAGFYDQAHLIREMKNISGFTPGQYINQSNLLAANFLQIP